MPTRTSYIPIVKESNPVTTVSGAFASGGLDISRAGKKTLYLKSDSDGKVYIDFYDAANDVWDQVFEEDCDSGELYVNTFRDMFRQTTRVRYTKRGPGEATIYFCELYIEDHARTEY